MGVPSPVSAPDIEGTDTKSDGAEAEGDIASTRSMSVSRTAGMALTMAGSATKASREIEIGSPARPVASTPRGVKEDRGGREEDFDRADGRLVVIEDPLRVSEGARLDAHGAGWSAGDREGAETVGNSGRRSGDSGGR